MAFKCVCFFLHFHLRFSRFIVISWIIPPWFKKTHFIWPATATHWRYSKGNAIILSSTIHTLTPSSRWRRNLKPAEVRNLKSSRKKRTEMKKFTDGAEEFSKCQCLAERNRVQLRAAFAWSSKCDWERETETERKEQKVMIISNFGVRLLKLSTSNH